MTVASDFGKAVVGVTIGSALDCETNVEAEPEPRGASEPGRRVRPGQLRAMATCTCYSDGRSPHPRQGNFIHPHHLELQPHMTSAPYLPEPPRVFGAVGGHGQGLGVVRVTEWVVVGGVVRGKFGWSHGAKPIVHCLWLFKGILN